MIGRGVQAVDYSRVKLRLSPAEDGPWVSYTD
jgi:hypothetical protein